jgi:6-phosphogluconolactonase (cycloisomerase 2 family)
MKPYLSFQRLAVRFLSAALLFLPALAGTTSIVFAEATQPGAVYTSTNRTDGNSVVVYARGTDGSLTLAGSYGTGGNGTGSGLGSQGSVIVSADHSLLFVVNAGSDSISSFRIRPGQVLELVDIIPSEGLTPISLTFYNGLLYVLNAGVPNNITGFRVASNGDLTPLSNSTRPLSGDETDPAQVSFDKTGDTVIVTEKGTNQIDTYTVGKNGHLTGPFVHPSAGPVPFGFALDNQNTVLVSDAGDNGGASSYRVDDNGSLTPVSPNVVTGQAAACWVGITNSGQYGYVVNTGTGNITGVAIAPDGSIAQLDPDGVTGITGGNPSEIALSINSQFLYVLVNAKSAIAPFAIGADGSLEAFTQVETPGRLAGLAGY